MAVATATVVRTARVAALLLGVALASPATAEPLLSLEVRAAYGMAAGGGSGRATMRPSPLTLSALGAWAIRDEPRTAAYAGLVIETLDRTGAGLEAGLMLTPGRHARLHGGVKAIAQPYTLYGPSFGGGVCAAMDGLRMCADLTIDVFVAGTDLPDDAASVQGLFGLGMVVDAF